MKYFEKQTGWTMIIAMLIGTFACLGLYLLDPKAFPISAFGVLILVFVLVGLLFYQMTTSVTDNILQVKYGIGLIKFTFQLKDVSKTEILKTPWYYGLGIRYTPNGTLYNIQSRRAVRVTHGDNGRSKHFMVGTKRPDELSKILIEL